MHTISKKIIFSFALFVLLGLCVVVYAGKDTSFAVVPDNSSDSKDADITNYELESFFESVESMEKRELLRKIFYYPSDLLENSPVDKNLDTMEQAKIFASFSEEELGNIVAEMESNLPKLREEKQAEYEEAMKNVSK